MTAMKALILVAALLLLAAAPAPAQRNDRIKFAYDLDFEFSFDNRETDAGGNAFLDSKTLFTARLTPSFGVDIRQDRRIDHRFMFGIEAAKNMGDNLPNADESIESWKLFKEFTMYYRLRTRVGDTRYEGYAGIFPRYFTGTDRYRPNAVPQDMPAEYADCRPYGNAFLSEEKLFMDNNLDGLLLKAVRPRAYYEVGIDWMGLIADKRRERFECFSTGRADVLDWLRLGWTLSLYHYANSATVKGVVDNYFGEPFVQFRFGRLTGFQELALRLSWLQRFNRDRRLDTGWDAAQGALLTLDARRWNVGIHNETYCGTGLMPYFLKTDDGGNLYGSDLYFGNPFYRIHEDAFTPWSRKGGYNRLLLFWQPHISDFLDLRISAVFHYSDGGDAGVHFAFQGWQQMLSLVFHLDSSRLRRPSLSSRWL